MAHIPIHMDLDVAASAHKGAEAASVNHPDTNNQRASERIQLTELDDSSLKALLISNNGMISAVWALSCRTDAEYELLRRIQADALNQLSKKRKHTEEDASTDPSKENTSPPTSPHATSPSNASKKVKLVGDRLSKEEKTRLKEDERALKEESKRLKAEERAREKARKDEEMIKEKARRDEEAAKKEEEKAKQKAMKEEEKARKDGEKAR